MQNRQTFHCCCLVCRTRSPGTVSLLQFHGFNMQKRCSEEIERTLVEKFGARKNYSALNRSPLTLFTILRLEHWARWF